jgi:hypothetical protein
MGPTAAQVLMDLAFRGKAAKAAELVRAEAISIDYKDVTLKNLPS